MSTANTRKIEGFMSMAGEVPALAPHAIQIVGLDVEMNEENWPGFCPRAKEPLEDEWVKDIRDNGVRTPVDVYRDGDTVFMLEGRRRVRAARLVWDEQEKAGVEEKDRIKVRIIVRSGDKMFLFGFNTGSENKKLRTPGHKAALMLHAQKYGAEDKDLARLFFCTVQTVKNTLAYFSMTTDLQKAVDTGFPIREAIKLADKPREEQKKILGELEAAGATRGAAAGNAIAKIKRGEKVEKADKTRMLSKAFIEKLTPMLEAEGFHELAHVLKVVTGEKPLTALGDAVMPTLVAAGYKEKKPKVPKEKKAKKVKELKPPKAPKAPKPVKEKKAKPVKVAKAPKAKKSKKAA